MSASYSQEGYLQENYRLFHLRDTAGQERDFHFHSFDKMVILLDGRVDYLVDRATYALQPWDILLVSHHVIHKALIDVSNPYERVILYLDRQYAERAAPGAGLMECFDAADKRGQYLLKPGPEEIGRLRGLLSSLEEAMADGQFGAQALRDTLVTQLLIAVNRLSPAVSTRDAPAETSYDAKIAGTLSYINENLSGPLTVEALAERAYLSKYHFMRLFNSRMK